MAVEANPPVDALIADGKLADAAAILAAIEMETRRLRSADAGRSGLRRLLGAIGLDARRRRQQALAQQTIQALETLLKHPPRDPGSIQHIVRCGPGVLPRAKDVAATVVLPLEGELHTCRNAVVAAARFVPAKHRLLLLADASLPRPVAAVVNRFQRDLANVTVLPSPPADVGTAIAAVPGDVLLVAAGTRLKAGWFNKLREAAHAAADLAMITSGDQSVPDCAYIRRDALTALGTFHSEAASPGQAMAEWSQRAIAAGWRRASVEFAPPNAQHMATVDAPLVMDQLPTLLLVVFAGGGGTVKTNLDLARGIGDAWHVLLLEMAPDQWTLSEVRAGSVRTAEVVQHPELAALGEPLPSAHDETLRRWITQHRINVVHFRHWLGSAPELLTSASEGGARVVVSLHDYYTLCPSLHLMDASGGCCFGDCSSHGSAIAASGDCRAVESWPGQAAGVKLWQDFVHAWRLRTHAALRKADALVTMTDSVRDLTCRWLPDLASKFRIIEHGRDFDASAVDAAAFPKPGEPVRLLFLGESTVLKGADLLLQIAEIAAAQGRPWEFHFLGKMFVKAPELPNITLHGAYERDKLPATLAALRPALIMLPARSPETYCHTLTEAWSCGIPVLAHAIGALCERIEKHGGGWLVEDLDAQHWLARLDAILSNPADYETRRAQACRRPFREVAAMTADFLQLYEELRASTGENAR